MPDAPEVKTYPSLEGMNSDAIETELAERGVEAPTRWFFYSLEQRRNFLDIARKGTLSPESTGKESLWDVLKQRAAATGAKAQDASAITVSPHATKDDPYAGGERNPTEEEFWGPGGKQAYDAWKAAEEARRR